MGHMPLHVGQTPLWLHFGRLDWHGSLACFAETALELNTARINACFGRCRFDFANSVHAFHCPQLGRCMIVCGNMSLELSVELPLSESKDSDLARN